MASSIDEVGQPRSLLFLAMRTVEGGVIRINDSSPWRLYLDDPLCCANVLVDILQVNGIYLCI